MNGIIVVNKDKGYTSFDVVAALRRLSGEHKIGHCGTLDPNATGVLVVCLGTATRLIEYMDDAVKSYSCGCLLGQRTDTQDIWGEVTERYNGSVWPDEAEVSELLKSFLGDIDQLPPMYSAVKVKGRKLYEYARKGQSVELKPRHVTVHEIGLKGFYPDEHRFCFDVTCSRGTYIRAICDELGEKLGTHACMDSLVRTDACGFTLADAVDMESLKNGDLSDYLLPLEKVFSGSERISLKGEKARLFMNGNPDWSRGLEFTERTPVFYGETLLGIAENGRILKVIPNDNLKITE